MPLAPPKFVPYEAKTILIKVYSYHDKNIVGALKNVSLERDERFENLTQMLLGIEQILDGNQFPQANLKARSFVPVGEKKAEVPSVADDGDIKPIATFKLSVLFRQNASWQGNLIWMEQNSEAQFRSALELVQLMDSVL